ncbi:MAG TPA: RNase H family protein [Candidatus Binatia bacterium]|nr:RNase H family protein [Candidatus Binatia bacterium]
MVHAMEKGWAHRWRANGWRRQNRRMAENRDLWEELLTCCERHQVHFEWIRGHAGHAENERCDQLAFHAARLSNLPAGGRGDRPGAAAFRKGYAKERRTNGLSRDRPSAGRRPTPSRGWQRAPHLAA